MKIIFGLGNPGKEYENTRHNTGFKVADYLNDKWGGNFSASGGPAVGWSFDKKLNSETSEINVSGKKLLLVKPQTFVNKSGEAISATKQIVAVPKPGFWNGLLSVVSSPGFLVSMIILMGVMWFLVWFIQRQHQKAQP